MKNGSCARATGGEKVRILKLDLAGNGFFVLHEAVCSSNDSQERKCSGSVSHQKYRRMKPLRMDVFDNPKGLSVNLVLVAKSKGPFSDKIQGELHSQHAKQEANDVDETPTDPCASR
jgi:hypothetical protein